jgi:HlyD family secretion protein
MFPTHQANQVNFANYGPDNIQLRSEEVQEIIGYVPSWIVRWGITVFFAMLVLIVSAAWLIHYPDIVKAPFRLTSVDAPKAIHTRTEGILIKLFVADNTVVRKGALLAYLESTADHDEVLQLANHLDSLSVWMNTGRTGRLDNLPLPTYNRLGELQAVYQPFSLAYAEMLSFLSNGFYLAKKRVLQRELADLASLESNLHEQQVIQQRDFELAQQDFEAQRQLANEKVVAPLEFKREESKLLARKMPLKQLESAIINNHAAESAKLKELLELDKLIAEQRSKFLQSLNTLRSAVESWKQKYVLTSPSDGNVYFSSIVEEKQHLPVNQEVFFVAPHSETYFGTLLVPQQNFGKVKRGQKVLIKFSSYPYQEFGAVKGKIEFISEIPGRDSTFLAKVVMPEGLITNFGKQITYKAGMNAAGEIITEDTRLLEKVFYNFRKALDR